VATAAQTTITGTDANGLTLAYVAGSEAVYVNGALQVRGQDYTATNGTSVVMTAALAVNDVVEIFAYTAFTVANAYTKSETDGVAAAAAGLRMVVPTSVAVGSGTGSVDAIGNVTFSGASSVSLNGCFSSTYDNYLINWDLVSSVSFGLQVRFRSGSTDATTSDYHTQLGQDNSTSVTGLRVAGASFLDLFPSGQVTSRGSYLIQLPFLAAQTSLIGTSYDLTNDRSVRSMGRYNSTNSYNGITFLASTGTMTGTFRVYGYKD
jgi:hypothetical protein